MNGINQSKLQRRTGQPRRGFALIVAISLMSMILLLLVSLATFTQVELFTAATDAQKQQARENARLGLLVALGKLQAAAGPDQRVTARAEILGDGNYAPENRFWTGVWNTTDMTADPVWLVSGGGTPESPTDPSNSVTLVGAATVTNSDDQVNAAKTAIIDRQGATIGAYAYWVSDDSQKIDVSVRGERNMDWLPDEYERSLPLLQTPRRSTFESIFPDDAEFDQDTAANEAMLRRAISLAALKTTSEKTSAQIGEDYHDLTIGATSLLTNSDQGGLKINLTLDEPLDPTSNNVFENGELHAYFATHENFRWIQPPGSPPFKALDMSNFPPEISRNELRDGQFRRQFGPVITEIVAYLSVFQRASKPAMRFYLDVELFNPWSFPVVTDSSEVNDLEVRFSGLPEIRITNQNTGQNSGWVKIDDLKRSGGTGVGSWMTLDNNPNAWKSSSRPSYMLPGELFHLRDPDPDVQDEGLWLNMSAYSIGTVENDHRIRVEGRTPSGVDGFKIQLFQRPVDANSEPVFEISNIPYDDFIYRFLPAVGNENGPNYIQGKGYGEDIIVEDTYIMAFHVYFPGAWDNTQANPLLTGWDFRNRSLDYEDVLEMPDGTQVEVKNLINFNPNPIESRQNFKFDQQELFSAGLPRSRAVDNYRSVRLFDFPDSQPLSPAAARHAWIGGYKQNSLGGPEAGAMNRAFDQFFYSTAPDQADWDPAQHDLPNHRLKLQLPAGVSRNVLRQRASADQVAQYFVIKGGFNINSVSPDAWLGLLTQDLSGEAKWRYRDANQQPKSKDLTNPFFRHTFSADDFAADPLTDEEASSGSYLNAFRNVPEARRPLYSQGFRALAGENGKRQMKQLAWRIADINRQAMEQREAPFPSLAAFLNWRHDSIAPDGIIQAAIDGVGPAIEDDELELASVDPINRGIPPHSPLYLQQQDVVALIAPVLTTRGDTFTIRSYGEVRNPFDGDIIESRAYLEAKVQRTYGENLTATANRPFKIVSFQWLNPDEI